MAKKKVARKKDSERKKERSDYVWSNIHDI